MESILNIRPVLAEALAKRKNQALTRIKLLNIMAYGSLSNFNKGWDKPRYSVNTKTGQEKSRKKSVAIMYILFEKKTALL